MINKLKTILFSLVCVGVSAQTNNNVATVDVVFLIDESGSLDEEQAQVKARSREIFQKLRQETGNLFRVGLVGFGSSSKPKGRLVTPLTDDQSTFYDGLSNLKVDGADEAGFTATSYVALDDGTALGGYMDGGTGSTFPSQNGFCAFLVADEPSNHDISSRNTVGEVAPLLLDAGNSTFFGVVRSDELAETGNTYGHLAAATGGYVMDIQDFVTNATKAAEIMDRMLTECVHTIQSRCTPNGPYIFNQTSLPFQITLSGSPTCSDGNDPIDAFWTSDSSAVVIQNATNDAQALVTASGEHRVCHTVTCYDATMGTQVESTCCTQVVVTEAPIVTEGRMVVVQGTVRRLGGYHASSRRKLRANAHSSNNATAHITYGGPDDTFGISVYRPGYIKGMTVLLEKAVSQGEIQFHIKVNGGRATSGDDHLSFTAAADGDGKSKVLELSQPIAVYAGNVVEIEILESRFPGQIKGNVQDVKPVTNKAGFMLVLEH